MCPRSTLGTISKCQPWKHSKVRSISEKSDATKQLPSCRIHTIEGYAFAGSEHISMLVINDNPIKVHFVPNWRNQHQHPQDCRLLCLRRPQARQVPALVLQCEAPACGEIRRWWWISLPWWPRPWTWWSLQWWPSPLVRRSSGCIQRPGISGTLEVGLPQPEQHGCSHFQRTSGKQHLQALSSNSFFFFLELPKALNRQLRLGNRATKSHSRDDQRGRVEGGQL